MCRRNQNNTGRGGKKLPMFECQKEHGRKRCGRELRNSSQTAAKVAAALLPAKRAKKEDCYFECCFCEWVYECLGLFRSAILFCCRKIIGTLLLLLACRHEREEVRACVNRFLLAVWVCGQLSLSVWRFISISGNGVSNCRREKKKCVNGGSGSSSSLSLLNRKNSASV